MQLVFLGFQVSRRSGGRNRRPVRAPRRVRSAEGRVGSAPCRAADLRKLPSQERNLGLVQGSTAPSSSESDLSGITRSRSKSMVLPNPWQRGQAPTGELKLNRIGSGGREFHAAGLALELLVEAQASRGAGARRSRKSLRRLRDNRFRRCRPGAGAGPGPIAMRSTSTKTGWLKSISSSDSGVENSKIRPA